MCPWSMVRGSGRTVTGESGAPLSRASTAPPLDGAMTETVDNLKSELDCEERQQGVVAPPAARGDFAGADVG